MFWEGFQDFEFLTCVSIFYVYQTLPKGPIIHVLMLKQKNEPKTSVCYKIKYSKVPHMYLMSLGPKFHLFHSMVSLVAGPFVTSLNMLNDPSMQERP